MIKKIINGPVGTFQRVMSMMPVFEPEAFAFQVILLLMQGRRSTTELRARMVYFRIFGHVYRIHCNYFVYLNIFL